MQKILRGAPAIIGIVTSLLLGITGTPITANAATITTATASEQYQLYDSKTRDQQVSVNKVWDDGLTNDVRKYGNADYANLLSMIIQTGVPQMRARALLEDGEDNAECGDDSERDIQRKYAGW